jgi:acyl carrier protein
MPSLNDELRTFITESIMYGQNTDSLKDDSSFLKSGVIDSTGVLELINYIEGRFGFIVSDEELIPQNLDSINNLIRFIERKTGGSSARAGAA